MHRIWKKNQIFNSQTIFFIQKYKKKLKKIESKYTKMRYFFTFKYELKYVFQNLSLKQFFKKSLFWQYKYIFFIQINGFQVMECKRFFIFLTNK